MTKRRLGKGLEALISTHSTESENRIVDGSLSIGKIIPNRNQPRQEFDSKKMIELVNSIKASGILQPLTVRDMEDGNYELIAGERRLRAAQEIGLKTVPVYILGIDEDVEMMEYALIENIQRVDLNPIEEAEAFAILSDRYKLSNEQIAKRVGKNRSTIANSLRLLKLPLEIKLAIKLGKISAGHARAILSLGKSYQMVDLFKKIISGNLSVREAESYAKKYSNKKSLKGKVEKDICTNIEVSNVENLLVSLFATKVTIQKNKLGKGKIHINFFDDDDFDRIIDILKEINN